MSIISRVILTDFTFEARNIQQTGNGHRVGYIKGGKTTVTKHAVVIETDDGLRGEYVTLWGSSPATRGEMDMLAPFLIGRDAFSREEIYDDLKREVRQWSGLGHGPLDIALWDLAGKHYNASISSMLGGFRKRLPVYASTYHGDRAGGLYCKEAFADFAEHCFELGYRAFKIHGWNDGNAKEEADNVLYVADRVGDRMTLMLDCACELRRYADALYVGRACDEAGYFWLEDPLRDNGQSAFVHNRLRAQLRTPLLQGEYLHGLEPKADLLIAGGTDFLRVDVEFDRGITGAMKIAHLGEAFGLDVEMHACGPAHRHVMAAMRNSNYYELALVGPDCPNMVPPVYTCGYSDQLDCVGDDGCVPVPQGPGLGVTYDWDYIRAHTVSSKVFGV